MAVQDLQQLVGYIYAENIYKAFYSLVKERCVGCQYDHPSQKQHLCLNPEEDSMAPVLFDIASERVDKFDLKLLFIETARSLYMDIKGFDFQQYVKDLETFWKHSEWERLEESCNVPEYVEIAVKAAKMKLVLLEKRVKKL